MKLDDLRPPLIKWTETTEQPVNNALMDYVDAAIRAALNDRTGHFSSLEAYERHKARLRQEFNDRLLQLTAAK